MKSQLPYGDNSVLQLNFDSQAEVKLGPSNCDTALADIREAVKSAVHEPVGYPPLPQCVVPNDQVALALDDGVPQATELLAAVLAEFDSAGIPPVNCTIVCPAAGRDQAESIRQDLPEEFREATIVIHDALDSNQLSYVAATEDGQPIYFNRHIADADFVVTISTIRPLNAPDDFGIHTGLFPQFADQASQQQFVARNIDAATKERVPSNQAANEAAWLLGIQFTIQVIPGDGSSILHVVAGQVDEVYKAGRKLSDLAWKCAFSQEADLVLASIDGSAEQHCWGNVARALTAAQRLVTNDGTIVLCTKLATPPGPALKRMTAAGELSELLQDLMREPSLDGGPASLVATARERARIFLLSDLPADDVEDLGLAFVADENEVQNLVRGHRSVIVLPSAQHVATSRDESWTQ